MEYLYIKQQTTVYQQAINLRIRLFFSEYKNALELINDKYEAAGILLVCLDEGKVVGTGRLNTENQTGIISQMAIDPNYQKRGIGKEIVKLLTQKCVELNVSKIVLSARKTAIKFYEKLGYTAFGDFYPSKKTGVIHREMFKDLS